MIIEIDERSGFCFGVVNAIGKAEESLRTVPHGVWSLGDIVHNRAEVQRLEKLGLKSVSEEDFPGLKGGTVLIRAHGEPPSTYETAGRNGITIIDATCPVVAELQTVVAAAHKKMSRVNGRVVILGKRGHAEVVGLAGQAGGDVTIIEGPEDIGNIDFSRPVYLLAQTTQSLDLFGQVRDMILERAADKNAVTVHDTICRQVANRKPRLQEFARRFDVAVFVSGSKSSNGQALFAAVNEANPRSYKVEDAGDIKKEWFDGSSSVGICGATSTPRWLMEQVAGAVEVMTT